MDKGFDEPIHSYLSVKGNTFRNSISDKYTINLNYLHNADISDNDSDTELIITRGKGCRY